MVNLEFENLSGCFKKEIEEKKSWAEFIVKNDPERLKEYHALRRIDPGAAPRNTGLGLLTDRVILDTFLPPSP